MRNRILWEGDYPALVTTGHGTVVGINSLAEDLLGVRAEEILGSRCHDVLCGRDPFGNRYCHTLCSLRVLHERREPAHDFVLEIRRPDGTAVAVRISALFVYDLAGDESLIVHVITATGAVTGVAGV